MTTNVTHNALINRINRRLARRNESIRWMRHPWIGVGDCYVICDDNRNTCIATCPDVEAYGRELGCLAPHEVVA